MQEASKIRLISPDPYRLPFDDDTFDLLVSEQVLEHVQNYPQTLTEINRVLKPGGVSLHFFPSRYTFIEPHVKIPLATVIQNYWWLNLWTALGIRNRHQKGLPAKDAARRSFEYLRGRTNYLTKSEIRQVVGHHFQTLHFAERYFLKHCRKGKLLAVMINVLPFLPLLYGGLRTRVIAFSD